MIMWLYFESVNTTLNWVDVRKKKKIHSG